MLLASPHSSRNEAGVVASHQRLGSISPASAHFHERQSPLVTSPCHPGCQHGARDGPAVAPGAAAVPGQASPCAGSGAGDGDKTQHFSGQGQMRFCGPLATSGTPSEAWCSVSRSDRHALAASLPRSDQQDFQHLQIASLLRKPLLFPPFPVPGHLPAEAQPCLLSPLLEIPV